MRLYPTELVDHVAPLPESVNQAVLNERGLYVMQGLDLSLAEQLVERSKEPEVVRYCKNDALSRFKDIAAIETWHKKGRLALPLVSMLGDDALRLEGLVWMGPGAPSDSEPQIPGADITFAERIYKDAAGHGNAFPYTRAALDAHDSLFGNNGVWLEAYVENIKATKTYANAGFEHFATVPAEQTSTGMDRVYMTLGNYALAND
jgi:hypothetical protein